LNGTTKGFRDRHNQYQRNYYESREKRTMQPSGSVYVERQLDFVVGATGITAQAPLLEIGAGLGRYTLPLLTRGFTVTALDLSPVMLARLAETAANPRLTTVAADVAECPKFLEDRFEQAIGFFTLHHMHDLDLVFAGLAGVLRPGANVAFCEPNAFCPLFYAQILLTPGMTWRGDGGVTRMRRKTVLGAMSRAGFGNLQLRRFGFLPPAIVNRRGGITVEDALQKIRFLEPLRAFSVFSGVRSG